MRTRPDWQMDNILITSMLLELEFKFGVDVGLDRGRKARVLGCLPKLGEGHGMFIPHYDELTVAFDKILRKGEVCITAVFAAEIILNIHKILKGKFSDAYRELHLRGAISENFLDIEWSGEKKYQKRNGLAPTKPELDRKWASDFVAIEAVSDSYSVKAVIKENSMIGLKQAIQEHAPNVLRPHYPQVEELYKLGFLSTSTLVASKSASFYYSHNPIYSGIESLKLSIGMEKIGVGAANAICSVSVSHLYNGLQQKDMIKGSWHACDAVIDENIGKLFMGSRPVTASLMVNRLFLCMKVPAAALAKTYRARSYTSSVF